ncbi:MAG: sensor domain-containing diguanylate cyclase [Candidatus Eisenbacteria bacterium]|nr:sensor domain-containing diguanylate cyclase [Candidatus Eisenbacteria bacterium]
MKKNLTFRTLLEDVIPVDRLTMAERGEIARALARDDKSELEDLALRAIDRLQQLGFLKYLGESREAQEKVIRYRNLLTSECIAIRVLSTTMADGVLKLKLPLPGARIRATFEQVRGILSLDDKILTEKDRLLTGTNDILAFVLDSARELTGCDHTTFSLSKSSKERLRYLEPIAQELQTAHEYVEEWVIDKGFMLYAADVSRTREMAQIVPPQCQSAAIVRVGGNGHPLCGALQVCSTRKDFFNEQKLMLLSLLADNCTSLLTKTERLGKLVFVDSLTQVYNRSYFDVQLSNEIARAMREKKSMALCIMDIDGFKSFNSRFGYEGGNEVLRQVAMMLKTGIRPFDSAARWGGEEFAVLLTAPVSETQARAICERLRTAIENAQLRTTDLSGSVVNATVTVSIGGALYPEDAPNAKELWRKANESLLEAKRPPKNKTLFWAELGLNDDGLPEAEK